MTTSIRCAHCKDRHATVAEVRACSQAAATLAIISANAAMDEIAERRSLPATEGMYRKGGQVYKVQRAVHGSGKLYAKVLVSGHFEIAPKAIRTLTQADRMTVEQAAEFGHLYGMCVRCAATLTDEDSIARGIGPVCAGKI